MGEVVRNLVMFIWTFSAIEGNVQAQPMETYTIEEEAPVGSQVVVYGSANEGNGHRDTVLLEQNNDENPLGNPIQAYNEHDNVSSQIQPVASVKVNEPSLEHNNIIQENLPENPKISPQETPQIVDKQIQNTLYVSGGRIYDLQSYPVSDVNYIETPNLNPTITTYPAY